MPLLTSCAERQSVGFVGEHCELRGVAICLLFFDAYPWAIWSGSWWKQIVHNFLSAWGSGSKSIQNYRTTSTKSVNFTDWRLILFITWLIYYLHIAQNQVCILLQLVYQRQFMLLLNQNLWDWKLFLNGTVYWAICQPGKDQFLGLAV